MQQVDLFVYLYVGDLFGTIVVIIVCSRATDYILV